MANVANTLSGTIITGTSDNDRILNQGADVTIEAQGGADSIMSWLSNDDKTPDHSSISGGSGNDSIDNRGLHVTISGGDDNDTISLSSSASLNLIQYAAGDYQTIRSGNDVIVIVNKYGQNFLLSYIGRVGFLGRLVRRRRRWRRRKFFGQRRKWRKRRRLLDGRHLKQRGQRLRLFGRSFGERFVGLIVRQRRLQWLKFFGQR